MKPPVYLFALCACLISFPSWAVTDAQIKKQMIAESIAGYPGNCACPYNTDRRGHACGRRSAWSKPGGYSPFCYPADIPDDMVQNMRDADPSLNEPDGTKK